MKHFISICAEMPGAVPPHARKWIRRAIVTTLAAEKVLVPCEINVLLTDNAGIQTYNREMRGIDKATDVLSFPMFELTPGAFPEDASPLQDPDGYVPLGDMCISLERAHQQAQEYGHSDERELSYLAVHSALHLLGYDHMDEGPQKRQMRAREKEIISALDLQTTQEKREEERE